MNALVRNAYASTATIIVSSLFISSVGSRGWPQLYFWVQVFSLAIFFSFLWIRKRDTYLTYLIVLFAALFMSVAVFLKPSNPFLIYSLGVLVLTSDLLGNIVNNSILSSMFSPHVLRQLDQQLIPADLFGRLLGGLLIEATSWFMRPDLYHFMLWLLLGMHIIFFHLIVKYSAKNRGTDQKAKPAQKNEKNNATFKTAWMYVVSHPLVQASLILMIWNQAIKFITQSLYYQATDHLATGLSDVSQFLSRMNFLLIGTTYLFQRFIGRRIVNDRSPAFLFAVMPLGLIALGLFALVFSPYWFLIFQYVYFSMINKAINAPMTRQCLFSIPKKQREKVYFLITILTSSLIMALSGLFGFVERISGIQELTILLICISIMIFFLLTNLDGHYVKTLWENFSSLRKSDLDSRLRVETRRIDFLGFIRDPNTDRRESHEATESEPIAPFLVPDEERARPIAGSLNQAIAQEERPFFRAIALTQSYVSSKQQSQLEEVSLSHKKLLTSQVQDDVHTGLLACSLMGLSEFRAAFRHFQESTSLGVSRLASQALYAERAVDSAIDRGLSSASRLKLQFLLLGDEHRTHRENLVSILRLPDPRLIEILIDAISDPDCSRFRGHFLRAVDSEQKRLNFSALIEAFNAARLDETRSLRMALLSLRGPGKMEKDLLKEVLKIITPLEEEACSLWKIQGRAEQERFMKALFLVEWTHPMAPYSRYILNTIDEFDSLDRSEKEVWAHLHYEFLKGTDFPVFRNLLQIGKV
ncbi:MAG: hypothetical protein AB1540_07740 [Bdellovibrionota bacterium]